MPSTRRRPLALAMTALIVLLAACGGAARRGTPSMQGDPDTQTSVRVENQSWHDVTVYALRETQRVRLGQVSANGVATFRIPDSLVSGASSVRFVVDPLGTGRTASSYEINAGRGDQLRLTIPNNAF